MMVVRRFNGNLVLFYRHMKYLFYLAYTKDLSLAHASTMKEVWRRVQGGIKISYPVKNQVLYGISFTKAEKIRE